MIPLYTPPICFRYNENQATWRVNNLQASPPHATSIFHNLLKFWWSEIFADQVQTKNRKTTKQRDATLWHVSELWNLSTLISYINKRHIIIANIISKKTELSWIKKRIVPHQWQIRQSNKTSFALVFSSSVSQEGRLRTTSAQHFNKQTRCCSGMTML